MASALLSAALPILGELGKSALPILGDLGKQLLGKGSEAAGEKARQLSPEAKAAFCKQEVAEAKLEGYMEGSQSVNDRRMPEIESPFEETNDDYGYVQRGELVGLKPRRKRHLRRDRRRRF